MPSASEGNRARLSAVITRANCIVSLFVWAPAWVKMWQTRSAHDYALLSLLIVLWLQASNLLVAILDHSQNLKLYLIVNTLTVAFTCAMVAWFQR